MIVCRDTPLVVVGRAARPTSDEWKRWVVVVRLGSRWDVLPAMDSVMAKLWILEHRDKGNMVVREMVRLTKFLCGYGCSHHTVHSGGMVW
jgi:hypothetical protein